MKGDRRTSATGDSDDSNFNLRSELVTNYSLSTVSSIGALDPTQPD